MKKATIRTTTGKEVEITVEFECTEYIGGYAHKFIIEKSDKIEKIITHFETGKVFAFLDLSKLDHDGVDMIQAMRKRIQKIVDKHGPARILEVLKNSKTIKRSSKLKT